MTTKRPSKTSDDKAKLIRRGAKSWDRIWRKHIEAIRDGGDIAKTRRALARWHTSRGYTVPSWITEV